MLSHFHLFWVNTQCYNTKYTFIETTHVNFYQGVYADKNCQSQISSTCAGFPQQSSTTICRFHLPAALVLCYCVRLSREQFVFLLMSPNAIALFAGRLLCLYFASCKIHTSYFVRFHVAVLLVSWIMQCSSSSCGVLVSKRHSFSLFSHSSSLLLSHFHVEFDCNPMCGLEVFCNFQFYFIFIARWMRSSGLGLDWFSKKHFSNQFFVLFC